MWKLRAWWHILVTVLLLLILLYKLPQRLSHGSLIRCVFLSLCPEAILGRRLRDGLYLPLGEVRASATSAGSVSPLHSVCDDLTDVLASLDWGATQTLTRPSCPRSLLGPLLGSGTSKPSGLMHRDPAASPELVACAEEALASVALHGQPLMLVT